MSHLPVWQVHKRRYQHRLWRQNKGSDYLDEILTKRSVRLPVVDSCRLPQNSPNRRSGKSHSLKRWLAWGVNDETASKRAAQSDWRRPWSLYQPLCPKAERVWKRRNLRRKQEAAAQIIHLYNTVISSRCNPFPVGRKSQRIHGTFVSRKRPNATLTSDIPNLEGKYF